MTELILLGRLILSFARTRLLLPLISTSVEKVGEWRAIWKEWLLP